MSNEIKKLGAAIRHVRELMPERHEERVDVSDSVHVITWVIPWQAKGVAVEALLAMFRDGVEAFTIDHYYAGQDFRLTIRTLEDVADLHEALAVADQPEPALVTVCCVCKRAELDGKWIGGREADNLCSGRRLTHGYCPSCFAAEDRRADGKAAEQADRAAS